MRPSFRAAALVLVLAALAVLGRAVLAGDGTPAAAPEPARLTPGGAVTPTVVAAPTPVAEPTATPRPSPTPTPTPTPPPPALGADGIGATTWTLVFRDEFEGTEVDPRRWTDCYWWDRDGCSNEGNNELEWYTADRRSVSEGILRLRAEPLGDEVAPPGYTYGSGMVTTGRATSDLSEAPRFAFTYGIVEVRARVPAGTGLWPALWLLPLTHESRPEIDILEVLGDRTDVLEFHLHTVDAAGDRVSFGKSTQAVDAADGYHVYSVAWRPDSVTWFVDGVEQLRIVDHVPAEPLYFIANLAVGGDWPGPPDASTVFPADFEIDYVRIWQSPDDPGGASGLAVRDD